MKLLIKIGGTLLDEAASRDALAADLAAAAAAGHELVVVHGGGRQITRFLEERRIESRFVNGLRVSTPEVIDALLKVLAGTVNHELVAALARVGGRAVGLSGLDAGIAQAEQLTEELGFVGRIVEADPALPRLLTSRGYVPVIACVAGGRAGVIYNVNADQMAVACAAAFGAEALWFLTDVNAVRGADGLDVAALAPEACRRLIATGSASGGMEAKLNAAMRALELGVQRVRIAPGAASGIVGRLLGGEAVGTVIHPEEAIRA